VNQPIQRPQPIHRLLHDARNGIKIREIAGDGLMAAAFQLNQSFIEALAAACNQCELRAEAGHEQCHVAPQTRRSAGDEKMLVGEVNEVDH
jgi:hypothetical protein